MFDEMKIDNRIFALSTILICYYLSLLNEYSHKLTYVKYLPFIYLFIFWMYRNRNFTIYIKKFTIPFLALLLGGMAYLPVIGVRGYKDLFFILNSMIFFILFKSVKIDYRVINVFFIIFWVFSLFKRDILLSTSSLILSKSAIEGTESFIFGIFFVFFLLNRNHVFFIVNAILIIFTLKRIVFISCFLVLIIYLVPEEIKNKFKIFYIIIPINLILILLLYLFSNGFFNDFIYKEFGVNAYHFSMGRLFVINEVFRMIGTDPVHYMFYGSGPGYAYGIAEKIFGIDSNLHSDILKLIIEYGLLTYILFIYFSYRFVSSKSRYLVLYFNILLITDNVIIYSLFLFFYFLAIDNIEFYMTDRRKYNNENQINTDLIVSTQSVDRFLLPTTPKKEL